MPAPRNIVLTPAQIAKQAERKAAKLAKKAAAVVNGPTISAAEAEKSRILLRKWAALPAALTVPGPQRVKIVTWNVSYSLGDGS
jgi:hypothetical protein